MELVMVVFADGVASVTGLLPIVDVADGAGGDETDTGGVVDRFAATTFAFPVSALVAVIVDAGSLLAVVVEVVVVVVVGSGIVDAVAVFSSFRF